MDDDRKPSPINDKAKNKPSLSISTIMYDHNGTQREENRTTFASISSPAFNAEYWKGTLNQPRENCQLDYTARRYTYPAPSTLLNRSLAWAGYPEQNKDEICEQPHSTSNYRCPMTSFLNSGNSHRLENTLYQQQREDELRLIMQNSNTIEYLRNRSLSTLDTYRRLHADVLFPEINAMNNVGTLAEKNLSGSQSIQTSSYATCDIINNEKSTSTPIEIHTNSTVSSTLDMSQMKLKKPKRPLTAYNFFFKDQREKIQQEGINSPIIYSHKSNGHKGLVTIVSSRWQQLSPSIKQHYDALALADRKRYNDEMVHYNKRKNEALTAVQQALEKTVPDEIRQRYFDKQSQVQAHQRNKSMGSK
jgi:HMG (high mobility group) box